MKIERQLCEKVCDVARAAGKFMRDERLNFSMKRVESKGLNDFVSYVDKEAEKLIVAQLQAILPEAGFLTEEATVEQTETPLRWIIDPLDGTTNYIHGLCPYSVSIGFTVHGAPMMGVVYLPQTDECFYAWKDGGAWLNGQRISVSDAPKLSDSMMITGFPYNNFATIDKDLELLKFFVANTHGFRRFGSAAADLCFVASGRAESFYERGLNAWDVAAGVLIVSEAGGKVTDYHNGENYLFGREIIATNGHIHRELQEVIKEYLL